MNIEYAKSPVWANADQTAVDLMVKFEQFDEELPFTAMPNDIVEHGRLLFTNALAGDYGTIAPYVPPTEEQVSAAVRGQRDQLLAATDWTQLPDVPQSTKDLWTPYRQALRDITLQSGFPYQVEWPQPPSA